MLRKKLSKVILSGLIAAMALGVSATAVQAKDTQIMAETTISDNIPEVKPETKLDSIPDTKPEQPNNPVVPSIVDVTQDNILETIKNENINEINVKTEIVLSQEIAQALEAKVTSGQFTINVFEGGSLKITSNFKLSGAKPGIIPEAPVYLNIVRHSSAPIISIDLSTAKEATNVSVRTVNFTDRAKSDKPIIDVIGVDKNKTVDINNVIINGGALLQEENPNVTVTALGFQNGGSIYVDTQVKQEVTIDPITLIGTTLIITGKAPANSNITLEIKEGSVVTKVEIESDAQGRFSTTFDGSVDKTYTLVAKTSVTNNGTTVEIVSKEQSVNTNSAVKINVTNIATDSANLELTYGSTFNTYPLILTVKNGSQELLPYKIDNSSTKEVLVTGLSLNTTYDYELTSEDSSGKINVLDAGKFTTKSSSTITGDSGSTIITDITINDINRSTIKDVSISIPVSNRSLVNSMETGRDFNVDIKGVNVEFKNGELILTGLVPEKEYRNTILTYVDKNGRTRTVRIATFTTKVAETKLRQFVKDVYYYSLSRVADEEGFVYWNDQLSNAKTSPENFVRNLLNEKEFINKHTTTTGKIEGLYQVIVNRKSDTEGLKFWTNKYDELVKQGYGESISLSLIVDQMVNENEFKQRVQGLGI